MEKRWSDERGMGEEQARRQASTDHRQESEEMIEGNGW